MPSRNTRRLTPLAALLLSLAGCAAEPTDTAVSPLSSAFFSPDRQAALRGVVRVNDCLGVLLRNDAVLAPRVCLPLAQRVDPGSIEVTYDGQTATARAVVTAVSSYSYSDYFIVRLASPFTVNGSAEGFVMPVAGRSVGQGYCWTRRDGHFSSSAYSIMSSNDYMSGGLYAFMGSDENGEGLAAGDLGAPCFNDAGALLGVTYQVGFVGDPSRFQLVNAVPAAPAVLRALGEGAPDNDQRAAAVPIKRSYDDPDGEVVYAGTTVGATPDNPATSACSCVNGGANVWYSIDVGSGPWNAIGPEVVYLDTSGSDYNTSLVLTDANGAVLAGQPGTAPGAFCNDDANCATGGFTSSQESRLAGVLQPGRYYVSVGGCGAGRYALHVQRRGLDRAAATSTAPLAGDGLATRVTAGTGVSQSACSGPTAAPEVADWFVTCGARPQFFSLCRSDGARFTRRVGAADFDPSITLESAATGAVVTCNDDGTTQGGADCRGTDGDDQPYGSRLDGTAAPRGLNAVVVDNRTGAAGMGYDLRYTIR